MGLKLVESDWSNTVTITQEGHRIEIFPPSIVETYDTLYQEGMVIKDGFIYVVKKPDIMVSMYVLVKIDVKLKTEEDVIVASSNIQFAGSNFAGRDGGSATCIGNKLYFFGGSTSQFDMVNDYITIFDLTTNIVKHVQCPFGSRIYIKHCIHGSNICFLGGMDMSTTSYPKTGYLFNTLTETFTLLPAFPESTNFHTGSPISYNNKIYIFTRSSTLENDEEYPPHCMYDPTNLAEPFYVTLPYIPLIPLKSTVIAISNKILFFGGLNTDTGLPQADILSLELLDKTIDKRYDIQSWDGSNAVFIDQGRTDPEIIIDGEYLYIWRGFTNSNRTGEVRDLIKYQFKTVCDSVPPFIPPPTPQI